MISASFLLPLLTNMRSIFASLAFVAVTQSQETDTRTETLTEKQSEVNFLSPSEQNGCVTPCDTFHSGATKHDTLVCMYQASGVGTLEQNIKTGNACFPPYNCREDWNVCIQWNATDAKVGRSAPEIIPKEDPMSDVTDNTKLRVACEEISNLVAGGNSGERPPAGGWKPTSLGWRKGSGNIGCGWVRFICFICFIFLLLSNFILLENFKNYNREAHFHMSQTKVMHII